MFTKGRWALKGKLQGGGGYEGNYTSRHLTLAKNGGSAFLPVWRSIGSLLLMEVESLGFPNTNWWKERKNLGKIVGGGLKQHKRGEIH